MAADSEDPGRRGIRLTHQRPPHRGAAPGVALALSVGLFWPALLAQAPPQTPPTFRASAQTAHVYPTVWDREGRLASSLTQDDFQILDNGKPAQITVFSREVQPITVAVMLDMSGSMMMRLLRAREGTIHFIRALLPADRARIGSFGNEIVVSPILTNDHILLERILREELWPGGGTPLWNGVYAAMQSLTGESGRRVVLALTDGQDTGSLPGWKGDYGDVRRLATRENIIVYAIGMEGMMRLAGDMIGLAEDTGGGHFDVVPDADLKSAFAQVADELRHQYAIGFRPVALDGKEHKLEVRVPRGMKVRARKSFVAGR